MKTAVKRIMIIAGEPSGDLHAAGLVQALAGRVPPDSIEIFGSAGPRMRSAGVEPIVRADDLSIVGLLEIGRALPMFVRAWNRLKAALYERKPDVVILVDFPDFNLKFSRLAKKHGAKVVYYISPQLWAWRQYRLESIRKNVDLLLSILPFEKDWYASKGVHHVRYVGNPTGNHVRPSTTRERFREMQGLDAATVVALLPGSRSKEIERILPVMLDALLLLRSRNEEMDVVIAAAGPKQLDQINQILHQHSSTVGVELQPIRVVANQTYDLLNAADVAAVTSGTATLEAGIIGTPMAVVYRSSAINYRLLKPLISVEHFGLVNLIAGERIATELIQQEFTSHSLAAELTHLLQPAINAEVRTKLKNLKDKLGDGDAGEAAADAVIELLA